MAFEFKLPDVGEGIHEGEIVNWLVKEGDAVKEDQPLVEIMTDKATVEITSPRTATILKLMGNAGDVVHVGAPLVVFGDHGERAPAAVAAATPAMTDGKRPEAPKPAPRPAAPSQPVATAAPATVPSTASARVLATPATRRLARERSVDINLVQGSGPGGRVTNEDVTRFAQSGGAAAAPAAPARTEPTKAAAKSDGPAPLFMGTEEERIPVRGVRKVIAQHMEQARDHVAPFTYVDEVDVTELVKLRSELKEAAEARNVKLSYLPFIIKACVAGLRKHPYLNAVYDEARQEIVVKRNYNIGIATASEAGLIVPVVKAADRRSMVEIAAEITRLSEATRAGKVAPEDLQGSTFTITSLGSLGGLFATPVVNYPELAIMGIHEIKKRPVVLDDQIAVRSVMLISLTFDHRIIDGHVGAAFANEVKALLQNPKRLLIEMA